MDRFKISSRYFKISLDFTMLSTILSYLFAVLYNTLIQQEYNFFFSRREVGVTPELLKRAKREGREMRRREADPNRP